MKKKKAAASKKGATLSRRRRRRPRNFLSDSGGILPGHFDGLSELSGKAKRAIRGVGRPNSIQDEAGAIRQLEALGKIQATKSECASLLSISEPTLYAFMKRVPAAEEAYERGRALGRLSLRWLQFRHAEKSPGMAQFLGGQILGQKDTRHTNHAGTVEHQHSYMTELLDQIDEKMRKAEEAQVAALLRAPTLESTKLRDGGQLDRNRLESP
jgi:hypothetical protein